MNRVLNDRLDGRAALVTGGSRGIGRATCFALAAKGAAVAVHYYAHSEAAGEVVDAILEAGGVAFPIGGDLADPAVPDHLVQEAIKQLGRLDILVNNAGVMTDAPVAELTDGLWDETLNINLSAVMRFARACLPFMRERGWGRIIGVTSQAAYMGSANHAHYATAKAGLSGFTFSLAKEVGAFGITVNLVSPGRILTDMLAERMAGREEEWLRQTPLRRLGQPEEVASAIAFLASDAARYITGATLHVNGGLLMS
jgi:3-oxoacyl-[acyl-carrier protein] reductase